VTARHAPSVVLPFMPIGRPPNRVGVAGVSGEELRLRWPGLFGNGAGRPHGSCPARPTSRSLHVPIRTTAVRAAAMTFSVPSTLTRKMRSCRSRVANGTPCGGPVGPRREEFRRAAARCEQPIDGANRRYCLWLGRRL